MVFASAAGRVWVTTSGSVRLGRGGENRVAGWSARRTAAAFTGTVTTYDLLDTGT